MSIAFDTACHTLYAPKTAYLIKTLITNNVAPLFAHMTTIPSGIPKL